MTNDTRIDWRIPLALLVLSAIPFAAGIARIAGLAGSPPITLENARFVAAPLPVIVHILSASLFSILGALQFSNELRRRTPQWHRVSGRIVGASGIFAALSGLWMTVEYPIPPELQGSLLCVVRVFVSLGMLLSIFLSISAAMQRNITVHRAWMVRAYALGQGAGMQVVVLLPWMLLLGKPSALQRDVLMSIAWSINLIVAELIIQKPSRNIFRLYRRTV